MKRTVLTVLLLILGITVTLEAQSKIVLRYADNSPDRKSGAGLVSQTLIDRYIAANPGVSFEIESLPNLNYSEKLRSQAAADDLPDVFTTWGLNCLGGYLFESGLLYSFDPSEFSAYEFVPGSLNGFMRQGRLYGLPVNADFFVLYYNQSLFDRYKVAIPKTFDDLMAAVKVFKANGIIPLSFAGKDRWPMNAFIQEFYLKYTGDQKTMFKYVRGQGKFSDDKAILEAVRAFSKFVSEGLFQSSLGTTDYMTAMNLFFQGKSAMYWQGSWDMSVKVNPNAPEEFKQSVHCTFFPANVASGGKTNDLIAYFGGGKSIAKRDDAAKQAAILKFYKWLMLPENWTRTMWQSSSGYPAQLLDRHLTGKENSLQKELMAILAKPNSIAGDLLYWNHNAWFKAETEDLSLNLALGQLTPEQYLKAIDDAVTKVRR